MDKAERLMAEAKKDRGGALLAAQPHTAAGEGKKT
jgi:hypothetical protein